MCSRASPESRVPLRRSCCSHITQQMGISKAGSTQTFQLALPAEGGTLSAVGMHIQEPWESVDSLFHFPAAGELLCSDPSVGAFLSCVIVAGRFPQHSLML